MTRVQQTDVCRVGGSICPSRARAVPDTSSRANPPLRRQAPKIYEVHSRAICSIRSQTPHRYGFSSFSYAKKSLNVRTTRLGRPRKHTARCMTSASLIPARQNPARRTDRCRSSGNTVAATAPRLTFVTIAKRPSHRGGMRDRTYFLIKRKKNFWTRRAEWKDGAASTGEISAWTQEIR
jgi:hypothetical protein